MSTIDRAYLEIDGDQLVCDSITIKATDGAQHITAMTPDNEPIGISRGNRQYSVSAELTMRDDEAVDFHQLWVDREEITVEVQFEGGVTWAWQTCELSEPGLSAKHGDKVSWSLELLCRGLQIS